MREFFEFDKWATTIVESTIFEAKKDGPIERQIPQAQDIVYQARRKYPDRDVDQALSLFLADKLEDFDRRDLDQNAVINAQRRENVKLNQSLSKLQQELDAIETNSEQTDAEIQRLKALSGRLTTDIEQRKVGARDIERALAQVEELRNKPGMDLSKYEELKKRIDDAEKSPRTVKPEEFEKFTKQLSALSAEQDIDRVQIDNLMSMAGDLRDKKYASQDDIAALTQQLQAVKDRPGIDSSQIQELEEKIQKAASLGISKETIDNLKTSIDNITSDKTGAVATIADMRAKLEREKEALANQEAAAKGATEKFGQKERDLAQKVTDIENREIEIAKTIDRLQQQEKDLYNTIETEKEKTANEFKAIQSKYRKAVKSRSKQASTLIRQFLNQEFPEVKKQIDKLLKSDEAQTDAIASLMQTDQQDTDTDTQGTFPAKLGSNVIPFLKSQKNMQTSTQSQATRNREMYTDDDVDNMPALKSVSESRTKLKEGASPDYIDLTPEQMRWISIANEIVFKGDPRDIERLMQLLQNLPEDVFLRNFVDEANLLIEKFDRGATRLKSGLKFIIQHIEKNAGRSINFQPSEDPILYSTFKSYRINWVNSKEEVLNDIRRYYRSEEKKQGYEADEPSLFPPMIGDEDDDYGAIDLTKPKSNLEESIEQMVDNIIGEDVARWIK